MAPLAALQRDQCSLVARRSATPFAAPHQQRASWHGGAVPRSSRRSLTCQAILSGPQRVSEAAGPTAAAIAAPHSSVPAPVPAHGSAAGLAISSSHASQRDHVVTHASDSSAEAVPLPEPERQPPRIDASWLNALVDSTVKAPYVAYSRALKSRPLLTKACTSMVGFILGDLIAQHFSHPGAVDVLRALRLGAYGLLIDGPVGSLWYDALERWVWPSDPSSTKAVLAKTALDQVVYATIMTAVYFAIIRSLEGHPELIMATLQAKFVPTLAANYMIWPLAHLVNFKFVPSDYRILYNNVVCVAWLTYLSLLTHSKFNLLSFLHLTH